MVTLLHIYPVWIEACWALSIAYKKTEVGAVRACNPLKGHTWTQSTKRTKDNMTLTLSFTVCAHNMCCDVSYSLVQVVSLLSRHCWRSKHTCTCMVKKLSSLLDVKAEAQSKYSTCLIGSAWYTINIAVTRSYSPRARFLTCCWHWVSYMYLMNTISAVNRVLLTHKSWWAHNYT